MSVYEMAKQYYPKLWDKNRIIKLYKSNIITKQQMNDILGADTNAD